MFGLGIDEHRARPIIPPTELSLHPHQLLFITGPSGSGKSSLLRLIENATAHRPDARLLRFDKLPPLPDQPLVDGLGDQPLPHILHALSRAGLNDAFVMLRRPSELSDGQRYRLRLAQVMLHLEPPQQDPTSAHPLTIILADEFAATLDRLTAKIIARNLRKWVDQTAVCFVAATTHDDLLESLEPDVLIEKHLGQHMEVVTRES
jgi:hypothetical protein